jgi:hypothetical protein
MSRWMAECVFCNVTETSTPHQCHSDAPKETSSYASLLHTRRIHVTRYRMRYDTIYDKITHCTLLSACKHTPVTAPHNRTGLLVDNLLVDSPAVGW